MRAPLQLTEPHLSQQHREHRRAEEKQPVRPLSACGEVAEAEEEGDQEDADDRAVRVHERVETPEPVDVLRLAAARVRSRRGGERAADDQQEAR